jgi:hypothetical protein
VSGTPIVAPPARPHVERPVASRKPYRSGRPTGSGGGRPHRRRSV